MAPIPKYLAFALIEDGGSRMPNFKGVKIIQIFLIIIKQNQETSNCKIFPVLIKIIIIIKNSAGKILIDIFFLKFFLII